MNAVARNTRSRRGLASILAVILPGFLALTLRQLPLTYEELQL